MKRLLLLMCSVIILSQFMIGCSENKSIEFEEVYSQVIGFNENEEKSKSIEQDAVLMLTNDDFQKFKDKYFTSRQISMESPDKEKAILYLQIPSSTASVNTYKVERINAGSNTLTIDLKDSGITEVDGIQGFNGTWKWVMLVEIDKTNLEGNMKIVVNKSN